MKSAPRELARDLLIVPTFQRTESNMLGFTEDTEKEKDHKLEMFYLWAMSACMQLRKRGFWADFTDPCSGYPVRIEIEIDRKRSFINVSRCWVPVGRKYTRMYTELRNY